MCQYELLCNAMGLVPVLAWPVLVCRPTFGSMAPPSRSDVVAVMCAGGGEWVWRQPVVGVRCLPGAWGAGRRAAGGQDPAWQHPVQVLQPAGRVRQRATLQVHARHAGRRRRLRVRGCVGSAWLSQDCRAMLCTGRDSPLSSLRPYMSLSLLAQPKLSLVAAFAGTAWGARAGRRIAACCVGSMPVGTAARVASARTPTRRGAPTWTSTTIGIRKMGACICILM